MHKKQTLLAIILGLLVGLILNSEREWFYKPKGDSVGGYLPTLERFEDNVLTDDKLSVGGGLVSDNIIDIEKSIIMSCLVKEDPEKTDVENAINLVKATDCMLKKGVENKVWSMFLDSLLIEGLKAKNVLQERESTKKWLEIEVNMSTFDKNLKLIKRN